MSCAPHFVMCAAAARRDVALFNPVWETPEAAQAHARGVRGSMDGGRRFGSGRMQPGGLSGARSPRVLMRRHTEGALTAEPFFR